MAELTFADAVRDALAEEMRRDRTVWALGEDLTTAAGSTSATQYVGLVEEFGEKRVVNTPISENTIMGAAVGAAVAGTMLGSAVAPWVNRRVADVTLRRAVLTWAAVGAVVAAGRVALTTV